MMTKDRVPKILRGNIREFREAIIPKMMMKDKVSQMNGLFLPLVSKLTLIKIYSCPNTLPTTEWQKPTNLKIV